ncbi:M60 family metallopeptidase [Mycoplasma bradburyae]|uniref:M60 family metallopeptidase n=1 Tax=Mycoplasma bradburyae TaxID=2963128 RepID=UPI0020CDE8F9|nr:M60 family metallopeptidase [Mycoplasma bradburyae]UTS71052.1 M60 family metallopeptidase [Mycoplasma bradburyae]
MLKTRKINKFIKLSALPASLILGSIITSCTPIPIISKIGKQEKQKTTDQNVDNSANPTVDNIGDNPIINDPSTSLTSINRRNENNDNDIIENAIANNANSSSEINNIDIRSKSYVNDEEWFKKLSTDDVVFVDGSAKTKRFYSRSDKVNNAEYETDLLNQYGDKGFRYPAWNYNYETGTNALLTLPEANSDGSPNVLNMSTAVFEEKVPTKYTDGRSGIRFNDSSWISNEIKNNRLKKHPAAKLWYQTMPTADTQAIEQDLKISTRRTGSVNTGVYAVPGEVVKIKLSPNTFNLLKQMYPNTDKALPFQAVLNINYWHNRPYDNSGRISNRYPFVQTTFSFTWNDFYEDEQCFKIGSPFGGSVTLEINNRISSNNGEPYSLEFNLTDGVEMLNYWYKSTSKKEWDDQIERIKNGKLKAPNVGIQSGYFSLATSFTADKTVAYLPINQVSFPETVMRKWESFFTSSFRWYGYNHKRINLKYCDDIWNGAGAWGGGDNLFAPIGWSSRFFIADDQFGLTNWGNYHEVNHNFEVKEDPFNIKNHGWTNIPSVINLSYINDILRYRNEVNINGEGNTDGWKRLANHYTLNKTYKDWYNFYANMVHTLGRDRFVDWTLSSGWNGRSWAGFDTVSYLSEFTGINFVYTLRNSYDRSNINNYDHSFKKASGYELNQGEQVWYDISLSKYPALDFVSSLYAAGSYWYDSRTKTYTYNGDTQPAYEIPAGESHTFDFENTIISRNDKFRWSELKLDSMTTKNGGKLERNPFNPKLIDYTPNLSKLNEIDEFDVTIVPDKWAERPEKYVPGYKFKIKIRNVVKGFEARIKEAAPSNWSISDINTAIRRLGTRRDVTRYPYSYNNSTDITESKQLLRLKGYYRAQADGDIKIKGQIDDWYKLTINPNGSSDDEANDIVTSSSSYQGGERILGEIKNAIKGRWYYISLDIYNNGGRGWAKVLAEINGQNLYNFSDNIIPESLAELDADKNNWDKYIDDYSYDYKERQFDIANRFKEELNTLYLLDDNNNKISTPFTTTSSLGNAGSDTNWTNINIIDGWNKRVEYWNTKEATFTWKFEKPVHLNLIQIKNYYRHYEHRPDRIKIFAKINGEEKQLINGRFGKDLERYYIDYNLNIEEIRIEFKKNSSTRNGIVIGSVGFYTDNRIDTFKSAINNDFNYYGAWKIDRNNKSFINGYALSTTTLNDYVEFTKDMKSYVIYGYTSNKPAVIDIYHDDKLVEENVEIRSQFDINNNKLIERFFDNKGNHKVKIVNKSNNPLVIGYYGINDKEDRIDTLPSSNL